LKVNGTRKDKTPNKVDDSSSVRGSRFTESKNNKYSGVKSKVR